jgi:hypothetical protein
VRRSLHRVPDFAWNEWNAGERLFAILEERLMGSSFGADAVLTGLPVQERKPRQNVRGFSPCPLPATRGEGGRRPGEGRFMGRAADAGLELSRQDAPARRACFGVPLQPLGKASVARLDQSWLTA